MPKLSREKKQSIIDTFAKNKQYEATAKIERVDPRTVKSVVQRQSKAYGVTSQSTPNTSASARVDLAGESTQGFQSVNNELSTNGPIDAQFLQDFRGVKKDVRIIKRIVKNLSNRGEVIFRNRLTKKVTHWRIDSALLEDRGLKRIMNSDHPAPVFLEVLKRHPRFFPLRARWNRKLDVF